MKTFICYTTLLLLHGSIFIRGDVFTSMVDLQDLHDTESFVIEIMESYINAREENIDLLRSYLDDYKRHHNKASEDVDKHISNPINAFKLVKRLTADLNQVERLMALDISKDYLTNLTSFKNTTTFPTDEDLSGAAEAIIRLQKTYRLNTRDLAQGKLPGVKNYTPLSVSDCFELGVRAYDQKNYRYSTFWLHKTLETVKMEKEKSTVATADVLLQYLILAEHKLGNITAAFTSLKEWLHYKPDHHISDLMKTNKNDIKKDLLKSMKEIQDNILFEKSSSLCRGKISRPIEMTSHLHCRFENRGSLFLRLAPFKVEEVHRDPDIVIVYDVVSEQEIETIKHLARPLLKRSTIGANITLKEATNRRISKTAILDHRAHERVAKLRERLQDFTRLDVNKAERLQVAQYGIGGHYGPHHDSLATPDNKVNDRIATVLLYMNDVEQGGATVFPFLQTAVWPKKAAAVLWYNLHPSGTVDTDTWHASCPVLLGSKWISSLWIREIGQEFHRPCIPDRSSEK